MHPNIYCTSDRVSGETEASNQVRSRTQTGFKRNCQEPMPNTGDRVQPGRLQLSEAAKLHLYLFMLAKHPVQARQAPWIPWQGE